MNMFTPFSPQKCRSISSTLYPSLAPYISSVSSAYSAIRTTSLITIFGNNFRDFSSIHFGTTETQSIFISSSQISFYVPSNLPYGTYPIQVFNDNLSSNVIDFTIDDNGNFWQLSSIDLSIYNSNNGGVNMGNSSVNAKYIQSASIPGAYFMIEEQNFVSTLPIYSSITTFSNVYSNNSNVQSEVGNSLNVNLTGYKNFLILPGYKLVILSSSSSIILDVENLSNNAVSYSTISNFGDPSSCLLYFYFNSTWNILNS